MSKKNKPTAHTGHTDAGHTRDLKVERIGKVTIYKRGDKYYLYYRQGGVSQRRRVDGNLAVARATAHKVIDALNDGRLSPIAYARTSPDKMVEGFLDAVAHVQNLALRTQDRYRAALERFKDFCQTSHIGSIDHVQEATVEQFVKFLRGLKRNRNGSTKGKKEVYEIGGIKFILSTCRTAFNWAGRHRMLPPFTENPFTRFPIDQLKDTKKAEKPSIFSPAQENAFFAACSAWQHSLFFILASYGLRLGELTHLLVEDVDFANGVLFIRSKPELFGRVKTGRERQLPLLPLTRPVFEQAVAGRAVGFVFLKEEYVNRRAKPVITIDTVSSSRVSSHSIWGRNRWRMGRRALRPELYHWCKRRKRLRSDRLKNDNTMTLRAEDKAPDAVRPGGPSASPASLAEDRRAGLAGTAGLCGRKGGSTSMATLMLRGPATGTKGATGLRGRHVQANRITVAAPADYPLQ